ncbi:MAG: hypothetical protein WCD33_09080 [Mycobacterium sp.]|uniref:hypothetical protein n=1 Tax=Mycobacterium sp. TaxID=1785 RepID=UPI003C70C05A
MNRRLILAGLAATGGLVTTAFLQVAVAAADVGATGADAFTIGDFTFDPFTGTGAAEVEGFAPVDPLSGAAPLLTLGGGTALGIPLADQHFEVFNPTSGTDLGSIDTNETVASLFGLTNAEFTVTSDTAAAGGSDSALPTVGSVYDEFNLGNGYENIYTDIPGAAGANDTVTDTLVTPFGNVNLDSLFGSVDAAAPLSPGDAFTGLEAGDSSIGADAFTIDGVTLDPTLASGAEGFTPVSPLATSPPLLEIGGGQLDGAINFAPQSFDVFSGTGTSATDVGSIATGEDVTDLFGFTNTEINVTGVTPADGGDAAALPTVGSVYDAFNLGNGYENVYTAIPGTAGGSDTVTDTLVTPFGNVNLDSLFGGVDAAAPLSPGDAFTGLEAGDSSIGADAFSIGDTTFDPTLTAGGAEGFTPVDQLVGAPPLLEIGGGTPNILGTTLGLAPQDFNIYDGTGASATEVGSITANEDVTNLLGLTNTEFTVTDVTPDADASASDLPTVGSVFDTFNFGDGIENVYTAIPGVDGAADTVTDTLVTPLGNLDLSSLLGGIDAVSALDPGAAFDAATTAASAIDPLAFLGL